MVNYHDDLKEVQGDHALVAALAATGDAAPFDRLAWFAALAEECGIQPLFAIAQHGDARLMLALQRRGRRIEALANWYSFWIRPMPVGGNMARPLLDALARDLAAQTPHLMLAPLPDENREASELAAALRGAGWAVFVQQCDVNHVLPVNGRSYAEYLADRPGALRTTLKRKAGKVAITIETAFNAESWAAYEAIYSESWKPAEGSPAFLRRFAKEEGAAGRLRLGLALADGRPVAAQLWTVEQGTAYIHKLAHNESSLPLSAGTTLTAAMLEQAIDRDQVALVDFGTGDDPYKRDWMEAVRPRYRIDAFRPAWPANWPAIAKSSLRRLVRAIGAG